MNKRELTELTDRELQLAKANCNAMENRTDADVVLWDQFLILIKSAAEKIDEEIKRRKFNNTAVKHKTETSEKRYVTTAKKKSIKSKSRLDTIEHHPFVDHIDIDVDENVLHLGIYYLKFEFFTIHAKDGYGWDEETTSMHCTDYQDGLDALEDLERIENE